MKLGIQFSIDINMNLLSFSDVDCAGNLNDHKSTFGVCSNLGNNSISWYNKKQSSISLPTAEAEYIVVEDVVHNIFV